MTLATRTGTTRADPRAARADAPRQPEIRHKTIKVGDLHIFFREAEPTDAPTLLLLHGFPTSSQMFRDLIPAVANEYHIIAPDYPGHGHSSMPFPLLAICAVSSCVARAHPAGQDGPDTLGHPRPRRTVADATSPLMIVSVCRAPAPGPTVPAIKAILGV